MFNKTLPNMHEVCRAMKAEFDKEKPKAWSLDDIKKAYQLLVQTTEEMNSRLFVILSAQQHGWQFARKLQFLEAGTHSYNLRRVFV